MFILLKILSRMPRKRHLLVLGKKEYAMKIFPSISCVNDAGIDSSGTKYYNVKRIKVSHIN